MKGESAQLYMREAAPAGGGRLPVVMFIHGAGAPAEVTFDARMDDYSWPGRKLQAGGRSRRRAGADERARWQTDHANLCVERHG